MKSNHEEFCRRCGWTRLFKWSDALYDWFCITCRGKRL